MNKEANLPTVRFRGAELRSITGNMEEGGIIYRLHFVSILSDKVADAMNWDILDNRNMLRDGLENPKLAGILRTDKLSLEPNGLPKEEKEKHTLQCDIVEVCGFQAITKKGDDSKEVYLKFTARSNASFSSIEKWWKKWGQSPCLGVAEGVLQATITEEPEDDPENPEGQATSEEQPEKPKRKRKGKQGEIFSDEEKASMGPVVVE